MKETCGVNNPEINRRELSKYREILFFKDGKAVIRLIDNPSHQLMLLKEEVDYLEKVLKQR